MSKTPGIPRHKTVPVGGRYEMHYHEQGSGPAVMYIHGSGPGASGYSNFKGNYPDLARAGYRTIIPDLMGYGLSSKPEGVDYDLDLFCNTLFDLLDVLGERECTLIGNSLGGAIAISMALRRPERIPRLVLMAPGGLAGMEVYRAMPGIKRMFEGFLGDGFTEAEFVELMKMLTSVPGIVTPALIGERYPIYKTQPKDVLGRLRSEDHSARLGELKMPILAFWGMKDQFCPPETATKIATQCPDARVVLYGDCGHWVMIEHQAEFNAYVRDFLAIKS